MAVSYLDYRVAGGYVHNWLVAGPHPVAAPIGSEAHETLCPSNLFPAGPPSEGPVEHAPLNVGDTSLTWRYVRCLEDHLVDASGDCPPGHQLWAVAYTQVLSQTSQQATITLAAGGPAVLYLGGQEKLHLEGRLAAGLGSASAQVTLSQGVNELWVCFGGQGEPAAPCVMSVRLGAPADLGALGVRLPTRAQRPHRRLTFEQVFDHAYLASQTVYKGNVIGLHWSEELDTRWSVAYSIQDEQGRTYLNGSTEARAYGTLNVGHPARLWESPYYVCLRANPREYYEEGLRYERLIPVHVLDTAYSQTPYGSYEERRQEALEHAAKREGNPLGEVAKMALGRWGDLDLGLLRAALQAIPKRGEGYAEHLLALLGAPYRFGQNAAFPSWLRHEIEACALAFRSSVPAGGRCACDGEHILVAACRLLADQLLAAPARDATDPGDQGGRLEIEQQMLAWLRGTGRHGSCEWDSNATYAEYVVALTHLADLAENEEIRELAAVVMDKLFFSLALNSFQGVFGSTHGHTRTHMILGGQLEATSGISRLLWGMGVWNQHIGGTVSLACSQYELPPLLGLIALDQPEEVWSRERHVWTTPVLDAVPSEVNKVTYKTPDYMLSSAQDYRPGQPGSEEHIWQATLGEDAVVFVNHPACMSEHDAHKPGFWRGNAVLPRVAQWKDTLVAVHALPEEDPLGFTHAYFPTRAFDEQMIQRGWAFARKGKAYLAITASGGLELVKRGPSAYRELRSPGPQSVWICQLGRASLDGSFEDFRRRLLDTQPEWQGLSVRFRTLRQQTLAFGWTGPLLVNGEEQPLAGYRHYDSPYCVADFPLDELEIRWKEAVLAINLA